MIAGRPTGAVAEQIAKLGDGRLIEAGVTEHIRPLFGRALAAEARRGEVYLANHSLGRPLDRTAEDVKRGLDLWYEQMDRSWDKGAWLDEVDRFRGLVARLIGLSRRDAVIPKTSAGQGLRAVLNSLPLDGASRPIRIVTTRGEFDSVDFILKAYEAKGLAEVTWVEPSGLEGSVPLFEADAILAFVSEKTDLVVASQVFFMTGQVLAGVDRFVRECRARGPLVLLDLYHSAGVIPLSFEETGADFAIGGSYKYLRGGPGACWLAVHPRHLDHPRLRTLDTGWFAKRDKFSYERPNEPAYASGGDAWLESTPPVLTAYQAVAGLEFTIGMGVDRLRDYSLRQLELLRQLCRDAGVPLFRPSDSDGFGAFALLPHPEAMAVAATLRDAGVNVDARQGFVRFGPDLLTSAADLEHAVIVAARVLEEAGL